MKLITRDQLHSEVWAEPMTKVAKKYDISSTALKKICEKHRIPTPPRGYWAKLAAGKQVKKTHYKKISDNKLNQIRIYGSHLNLSAESKTLVEIAEQKEKAKPTASKILPPIQSDKLHKHAVFIEKQLYKSETYGDGIHYASKDTGFIIKAGTNSINRVVNFISHFCYQAEQRSYSFVPTDKGLALKIEDEILKLEITEKLDRTRYIKTEAETKKYNSWIAKEKKSKWNWNEDVFTLPHYGGPNIPDFNYSPTGNLVFKFTENQYFGLRRTFGDGKTQTIESMMDDMFVAAVKLVAARKARKIENENRRREYEEKKLLAAEKRKRENLELKRIHVKGGVKSSHMAA